MHRITTKNPSSPAARTPEENRKGRPSQNRLTAVVPIPTPPRTLRIATRLGRSQLRAKSSCCRRVFRHGKLVQTTKTAPEQKPVQRFCQSGEYHRSQTKRAAKTTNSTHGRHLLRLGSSILNTSSVLAESATHPPARTQISAHLHRARSMPSLSSSSFCRRARGSRAYSVLRVTRRADARPAL